MSAREPVDRPTPDRGPSATPPEVPSDSGVAATTPQEPAPSPIAEARRLQILICVVHGGAVLGMVLLGAIIL